MKTQNKNNNLEFSKNSVLELNQSELSNVKGGGVTTLGCTLCINSSNGPGNTYLNNAKGL